MNFDIGRIYHLSDPITGDIKYIGKTRRMLEERLAVHFTHKYAKKNITNINSKWVRQLYEQYKLKPIITLIEEGSFNDIQLFERESYYIKEYLNKGYKLLNTNHNIELRQQLYPKFIKGITVFCYTIDNNCIIYRNSREASEKLSISYKRISSDIKNERVTIKYVFSFNELSNTEIKNRFDNYANKNALIIGTNLDTGKQVQYKTQTEAAKTLNLNFRNLNNCLQGLRLSCGGYKWERKINV